LINKNKITVAVITYNSESTVIETLESIKSQRYDIKAIDVIVSDDGSSDKTLLVVKNWIESNECLFHSLVLLSNTNEGISQNCNRCFLNSNTEYVKLIAGDDVLHTEAIKCYLEFAEKNKCGLLFSKLRGFSDDIDSSWDIPLDTDFFTLSPQKQLNSLVFGNYLPAPAAFISKKTFDSLGGFDSANKLMEDFPFWIKAFSHNIGANLIDKELVYYRVGGISDAKKILFNTNYEYCVLTLIEDQLIPKLNIYMRVLARQDVLVRKLQIILALRCFNNKANKFSFMLMKTLGLLSIVKLSKVFRGMKSQGKSYFFYKLKKLNIL